MSIPALLRDLQLPPSQRTQRAFKEQRRKQLEQHLLKRKTLFEYKQEHQILSRKQSVMTSKDQIQNGTNILKLQTKMANKENIDRPTQSKNNVTMEKNGIPSKSSSELTNSTLEIDTNNFEDGNQSLQLLQSKDDVPNQHMTFSQAFHLKKNNKKKQMPTEKLKQEANKPKKLVLGSYCGQVVASKINSFRKPLQVKDESSTANKKLSTNVSNASRPQPQTTSSVPVKGNRASDVTTITTIRSSASQNKLVRPPIRSHHDSGQDKQKQSIIRASASVTVQKGPHRKELVQLKTDISTVKTSFQDIKRNEARSKSIVSGNVTKPASSSNTKLIEKSKTTNQRRHTIAANTNVSNKSAHPKETAEQRKAHLTEWKAGKGRVLKRLPSSVVTQPEPEGQNGNPVRSFWTTMAEEDEQRLFTEKVNKTFSECLNLINEGCPKEEILVTLNDMIKNIPDATKLVKYWVCIARLEPVTSPVENIIAIYEKAILAGAQPIEEMRHAIADILTRKSQEKINFGENIKGACATKQQVQEVNIDDLEPEKLEMENIHGIAVLHDCDEEQEDKTTHPANDKETRESCLIKFNVSTTPYLQSAKKKIQFEETNSVFKEMKFLTPVRRSQRLQNKTSKLPDMLKDHYPCVSSLEQLTELGSETDAFVCRPNAALCRMYSEIETAEEK